MKVLLGASNPPPTSNLAAMRTGRMIAILFFENELEAGVLVGKASAEL